MAPLSRVLFHQVTPGYRLGIRTIRYENWLLTFICHTTTGGVCCVTSRASVVGGANDTPPAPMSTFPFASTLTFPQHRANKGDRLSCQATDAVLADSLI